jgi:hypothetical protein
MKINKIIKQLIVIIFVITCYFSVYLNVKAAIPSKFELANSGEIKLINSLNTDGLWYKVNLNVGDSIRLNFTDTLEGLSYGFQIFSHQDLLVNNNSSIMNENYMESDREFSCKITDAGIYYIKVYSNSGTWTGINLKMEFTIVTGDANENNDTWVMATELNNESQLTLSGSNDNDWFKVTTNKGESIKLNFINMPQGLSYGFSIISETTLNQGKTDSIMYQSYLTADKEFSCKTDGGIYYIKVYANSGTWSDKPFKIQYTPVAGDANENNDTWVTATELNNESQLTLSGSNDNDWFKVTTNKGESIKLNFINMPQGLSYGFSIISETTLNQGKTDSIMYQSYLTGDREFSCKTDGGIYYVKVNTNSGTWSDKPFEIQYTPVAGDANENNDTWVTATELNNESQLTLSGSNDNDWFKVITNKGESIKLNFINMPQGLSYGFSIISETTLKQGKSDSIMDQTYLTGDREFSCKTDGGIYYVKVNTNSGTWSDKPFKIQYTPVAGDANENNDTWTTATVLNNESQLTLNASNDVDWFKFGASKDATVELRFNNIPLNLRYGYTIYNEEILKQGKWDNIGNESYLSSDRIVTLKIPQTGIYYIKINPNSSTWSYKAFDVKLSGNTELEVKVTGVILNKETLSLTKGSSETLIATVFPINANNKNVTWTSISGNDVVSVSNGLVTALKPGVAIVRATSISDSTKYAECTIKVIPEVTASIDSSNKVVTLTFSENIVNNLASLDDLKSSITFAANGLDFVKLGTDDSILISEKNLIITFYTALTGRTNKIKVAANTIKDIEGYILGNEIITGNIVDITAPTVSANPGEGLYNRPQSVILTMSELGTIYYTLDGTGPSTNNRSYESPIIIDKNTILKYIAVDNAGNRSQVYTQVYTINTLPPLKVIAVSPEDGSNNVPVNKKIISIMFDSDILAGQNYDSISLKDSNGRNVDIATEIDKNTLIIRPKYDLDYNTNYTVKVPSEAVDGLLGNLLFEEYSFGFTTNPQSTQLMVIGSNPESNALDIPISKVITVLFNKDISVVWGTYKEYKNKDISLKSSDEPDIPITYRIEGNNLLITPVSDLEYDTTYELIVPASAIWDVDKNGLKENFVLKFTTEKMVPTISSIGNITMEANLGENYVLPNIVNVTMSDSTTREVLIKWSSQTVETSKADTYIYEGTVEGYEGKITLTLNVIGKKNDEKQKKGYRGKDIQVE